MLPQDPFILLSFINMKLRDEYESLDALSDGLESIGFKYDSAQNQFK